MADDRFTDADHERALRAGQAAMGLDAGKPKRGKPVRLTTLGLVVRDGAVYRDGLFERRLGLLSGARAQLGDVTRKHNVGAAALTLMPVIALTKRNQAMAYVVFPDGTVHERKLDGNRLVRNGEREVVQFNAMAGAA